MLTEARPPRAAALAAFKAEMDGIRVHDDEKTLELRSRDYFWYSPILNEQLEDCRGELVVIPTSQEEVFRVASAAARHRLPVTIRGGGTGNYGQCVPLDGGVILDMTRLDKVIEITPGHVRVEAGARISRLDDAVHETGQELLMYPSTRTLATIGGFIAGGSGGIGSFRNGMLRDNDNVTYARIVTVEPEPQIIELHGEAINKIQHAYGTNGILVEVGLGLTPATEWVHVAALFDGYDAALDFATGVQDQGLDLYLLTCVERRFSAYYRKLKDHFPADRDAVFAMVAPADLSRFRTEVENGGGAVTFALTKEEIHQQGLQPAYELGWNHTTLQALKIDKGWTYLQVAYPHPFDPALVLRQMQRHGDELFWHHEMAREQGRVQIFALPLVRYRGKDEMYALIRELEADGCTIFDPHVYTIEDGGMKTIDDTQIAFKKQADPYGLMNPGKTRGWTPEMALAE
ncbi:FAD-binding oxidoreductase [Paracoccus sp. PAR01]|uniref:FAD-binding oxidoreductase n=1 Tax=Paracoccus sp. PAR01 TaxID=2769282 RepID=UPI0017809ADE|nr:FAD-binding oxidoreductase [Paracoccus sp. PAR01]MBD9527100.1 FAD-binding oxidoreductase [Paracoccus sp. PAR01]